MRINARTGIISAGITASLVVVGISGWGVASGHKTVTVEADGISKVVSGFFPSVDAALNDAGVELGPYDSVSPEPHDPIGSTTVVEVARAQEFRSAGEDGSQWTTAETLADVVSDIAPETGIVVNRSATRDPLPLTAGAEKIKVIVDGSETEVATAGGETLDEVIARAGITLTPIDMVSMGADGRSIIVTTQRRGVVEKTEEIPFTERRIEDPELEEGTETVKEEGQKGERIIRTYRQTRGGVELVSVLLEDKVSTQPKERVIAVGTKKPEVQTSNETTTAGAATTMPANIGDPWAALAQCESGGNPSTNTGNGFYGMYQFTLGTWQSVGGTGLPSEASAEEQTRRAKILQERSGWGQWPACAASLGLL